jgi:hypothetical protein
MACSCPSSSKRTYYGQIQLFSNLSGGLPGGSSPPLGKTKEVTVCSECGLAQYSIPIEELSFYRQIEG